MSNLFAADQPLYQVIIIIIMLDKIIPLDDSVHIAKKVYCAESDLGKKIPLLN